MKKIKVLPIYPEFPHTFWSFKKALKYIGKKAIMPPTGLATVLAMLPKNYFDAQKIADLNTRNLKDKQIKESELVMISSMIIQEDSQNEIIDRAHFYKKPVVVGGVFPTEYPERNSKADYIITGEAEITLPVFIEDFLNGNPKKIYTEEEVIKNGRCKVKLNQFNKPYLDQTPIPRWDLLNLKNYDSVSIQYSRGCPGKCNFCDIIKLFGRVTRTKPPEQMIAELNALYNTGFRGSVYIAADNLMGNKKNLEGFLSKQITWQELNKYPFSYISEASIDLGWESNKGIRKMMNKAGYSKVFVGVESTDLEVLKKIGKEKNIKIPIEDSIINIQKDGIEVTAGIIIGLDDEKPNIFEKFYEFGQKTGIVELMPSLLTALKSTDFYKQLKEEKRLKGESTGNNTHQLYFNFKTQLNESFLFKGYKGLIKKLYDPKNYYERDRILQKNLGENARLENRKNLRDYIAFIKSIKNRLFAKGGLQYAKNLIRTAVKNPKYIPELVIRAIKLDDFMTITEKTLRENN